MIEFLEQLFGTDVKSAAVIVFNLILIESLLSVDNAAVLATMVMDLPPKQRSRALRYGIIGAYVFRGICLLFAAYLIKIWWLKPLGGIYLLYLTYDFFQSRSSQKTTAGIPDNEFITADDDPDEVLDAGVTAQNQAQPANKQEKWFYRITLGWMGPFWATVVAVEIMDLAFSIDNVFAAVAFTDNIYLICAGVFIGILAMRFVAQWFVRLLERYPYLEYSAFIVIGILGMKLLLALPCHFFAEHSLAQTIESESADIFISILTAGFFFIPMLTSRLFNWPVRRKK